MKILSSYTHLHVGPKLYKCLCSAEHKLRYSEECGKQSSSGAPLISIVFFFPTMEVNEKPWFTSKLRQLCQAKEDAYRKGDKVLYKLDKYTLEKEIRVAEELFR